MKWPTSGYFRILQLRKLKEQLKYIRQKILCQYLKNSRIVVSNICKWLQDAALSV
ncbi:hypothetical protein NBRC111894_1324 [Sporolactobacillus inulinus]|uniref:Uncharacterized protein n=1 Tax=Sporolactobacillus inulinus TaxID=2078 RepID=A0A4Y1Z9R6_9BACL|nr:hypothetical protein NBRC111894_1324 [Sporolactobacillus inulinus]